MLLNTQMCAHINEKYIGDGIIEHILKMSNTASKLKPIDLGLRLSF